MKEETLEKGRKIVSQLNTCRANLEKVKYTQNEEIEIRESSLAFNGIHGEITVPKSLFRVIGKLIESEYIQHISKLEKELEKL